MSLFLFIKSDMEIVAKGFMLLPRWFGKGDSCDFGDSSTQERKRFQTDPRSVAANTCSSNVLVVHRGPGAADHVAAMKELDYVFAELF